MQIIPNTHLPKTPQNAAGLLRAYSAFIVWNIKKLEAAKNLLGDLSDLEKDVNFPDPNHTFSCVCGFSIGGFEKIFNKGCGCAPDGLIKMPHIKGAKHDVHADASDGLFHLRASSLGVIEQFLENIETKYPDALKIEKRVIGYNLNQNRDWLGFVDGTAVPETQAERDACTLIPKDQPYALGSYALFQTYVHNLEAWHKTAIPEQENIIGRTKLENVQQKNQKSNSHIALNTIVVDGVEMDIVRDNAPFTTEDGKRGTAFIGYAAQSAVLLQMLTNMFVGNPKGNYDHILDYSQNTFSCLYFCPTKDTLDAISG